MVGINVTPFLFLCFTLIWNQVEGGCSLSCLNGGVCKTRATTGSIQAEYCECPRVDTDTIYTGNRCEKLRISRSCNKTCQHGGECVFTYDQDSTCKTFHQQCDCQEPYTGEFCEKYSVEVECMKACQNGGRCTLVDNGDKRCTRDSCVCPTNYRGEFCETYANTLECIPPCVSGQGDCIIIENSKLAPHLTDKAYCNCSSNATGYFFGSQCGFYRQRPAECNMTCLNGGTCLGSTCKCARNLTGFYNGDHCENFTRNDVCVPSCFNGYCQYGKCLCFDNSTGRFSGKQCDQFESADEACSPACENGGVCSYGRCECESNSTHRVYGYYCHRTTECSPECENGGICGYNEKCECPFRYTGEQCQDYVQECPCVNGGFCADNKCNCVFNETGVSFGLSCQIFIPLIPCYPVALNGGFCVNEVTACPYDEYGYFHGDQCVEYGRHSCTTACLDFQDCVGDICSCPFNLTTSPRYLTEGLRCETTRYV
ncbi:neurogenic locus notch homolog protein 1 [Patella vulgata]|uniref:neurogenic locus notch homolog protein 1 n=1 Tax=Patella vulgata TaxID=6465 RepID=UPI00217FAD7A|nr:neurogenic locus notch homolog protein 1 [Patella vulgata]